MTTAADPVDPVALSRALIRCPSVTPLDEGVFDCLARALVPAGFSVRIMDFSAPGTATVRNLFARWGEGRPHFTFAGHLDVVPAGDLAAWSLDPFGGEIVDGHVTGRGASDMKSAVAAFAAAAGRVIASCRTPPGSISMLVTGDEEGPAVNGTCRMLETLDREGEKFDACLVGEPTSLARCGDTIKIGRRGSLDIGIRVLGAQGHVAYPRMADNPVPRLCAVMEGLCGRHLDDGAPGFEPSGLEIVGLSTSSDVSNVIPAWAMCTANIRFNTAHSGESLSAWIRELCAARAGAHELSLACNAEPFLCGPGDLVELVRREAAAALGVEASLTTGGGTSDARFIHRYCQVVELGLSGQTMHKVDEKVAAEDIHALSRAYERILRAWFAARGRAIPTC